MKSKLTLIIVLFFILTACNEATHNEGSMIKVLDKEIIQNEFWIEVEQLYTTDAQNFKIRIDNENTWNLIETNRDYLVTYTYESIKNGATLGSIKLPEK